MSHASPRKPRATFEGFPTGSAIAIVCAALFTGGLLSVYAGDISWPFLTLFAVATIVVATAVNPRGLFLTVALTPLLYALAIVATGLFIASGSTAGGVGISRTDVLVIAYPMLQTFPVLAATTLGAVVIALVRLQLLKRHNENVARQERAERRRVARSNRRTSSEGRRARERVTVSELQEIVERRERARRPLNDNLYGD
ncbi:hypothetical protein SAMN04488535_0209 [Corynebacterium mycetoides]|uniref:DUF6542 domain-containing protein n=1 Tax=Corynebacterium mycetoides TaxID=38302 RepID=A0A1G9LL64_9CORY|nr:DUF6542 domain-containing protein [Corynebacterium mycetoides]SDL62722.1 hypothetical protein SAMN04488535_0209 [Corynebacterium mycetoides]